jgi:hypothetical protein
MYFSDDVFSLSFISVFLGYDGLFFVFLLNNTCKHEYTCQ